MNKDCYQHIIPTHINFPYSWLGHTPFAMWLTCAIEPRVFVELGTHSGNSYLSVCESIKYHNLNTRCYAVDTWQGDPHAEFYDGQVYQDLKAIHDQPYGQFSTLLRMTFDQAIEQFEDQSIDLLHIDGLHTYQAVKHDFQNWLPKLSPNAIVLFHDTSVKERDFGVWQLWQELEQQYQHTFNFQHSNGLGVLAIGQPHPNLEPLFSQRKDFYMRFVNTGNQLLFHTNLKDINQHLTQLEPQRQALAQLFDTEIHQANLSILALQEHETLKSAYQASLETKNNDSQLIQTISDKLSQTEAKLNEAETKLDQTQAKLNQIHAQLVETDQLKNQIIQSKSWRLTMPLRAIGTQLPSSPLGGLIKLIRLFKNKTQEYGLKTALKKAIYYYKKHGITEFNRRAKEEANLPTQSYHQWMINEALPNRQAEAEQIIQNWQVKQITRPLISIVMPVYDVDFDLLTACIDSVKNQSYVNWELCICNDASPKEGMQAFLDKQAKADQRIKVIHHDQNGHISKASNSALTLATGDYVALLDNDDLLPADALTWVANEIIEHPNAKIIYSDEDKIGTNGEFFNPYFKSDWNPELFYAHNMISHLGVYSRSLLQEIDGFRIGLEGSQDYDLALRCIERIQPAQIRHIPKVLYHWRVLPGSTAVSQDEKPYAAQAALKALNQYLEKQQIKGQVVAYKHGHYRFIHHPLEQQPSVTLIIPTKNAYQLVKNCIESVLQKTTYQNYDIILIDNGSDDPTALAYFEQLKQNNKIQVIRDDRPFNYSALNNAAVKQTQAEYIVLLNNDIEVITPEWLTEMVSWGLHHDVGAVGAKLLYPDGRVQHGGVILGLGGVAGHAHHLIDDQSPGYFGKAMVAHQVTAVTAACLLVKRQTYLEVGGLNEKDLTIAFNDVDFCLKLHQKGLRNIWTPHAKLTHYESVSRGYEDTPEKQKRFESEVNYMLKNWSSIIDNDPMYNPNLSLRTPYQYRFTD